MGGRGDAGRHRPHRAQGRDRASAHGAQLSRRGTRSPPPAAAAGRAGPAGIGWRIRLPLLTSDAVSRMAVPKSVDAADLYVKTGGNPFFVSEVLAAEGRGVPDTVRDAVLARAARLSPARIERFEAASILQPPAERWLLESVAPEAALHLDECLTSGMLIPTIAAVSFRHELARLAVRPRSRPMRGAHCTTPPSSHSKRVPPRRTTRAGSPTMPRLLRRPLRCCNMHRAQRSPRSLPARIAKPQRNTPGRCVSWPMPAPSARRSLRRPFL